MMFKFIKNWLLIVLCLFLFVLSAGGWYVWQVAPIGAAFKAKLLCSAVFVSHRDPATVLASDLSAEVHPTLSFLDTKVDFIKKSVSANLYGWHRQQAVFHEHSGCTLLHEDSSVIVSNQVKKTTLLPINQHENTLITNNQFLIWPTEQWDVAYPPSGIVLALNWAFAEPVSAPPRRTRAVVIVKAGRIVAERYALGIKPITPLLGWSMTKSVLGALIGIAVDQGRLSLNSPVKITEWQTPGDLRSTITLNQLLRMSSGLQFQEDYDSPFADVAKMLFASNDMAAYAVEKPLVAPPGKYFSYSSGSSNIIARILKEAMPSEEYANFPYSALFQPLGMSTAVFELDGVGTLVGSSSLYASPRDWARLGLLYARGGRWQNKQLISADWLKYSLTPTITDHSGEFGAHLWLKVGREYRRSHSAASDLPKDILHFGGHEGQFVTIIPSQDLVIVRMGLTRGPHGTWDHEKFIRRVLAGFAEQH